MTSSSDEGPNKVAVVVNGNAKSVTSEVIATLDEILDSGDLYVSKRVEDSGKIARTLLDRGYDTILTGGGDGTFTVVVTSVVREAKRRGVPLPRFGLLRLGTGNSLAWVVGASPASGGKQAAAGALSADLAKLRSDAGSRPLALVEVEDVVTPFCGFGIDANVLADYGATKTALARGPLARVAPGLLSYAVAATTRTLPSYLLKKTPHCRVINRGGEAVRIGPGGSSRGRAFGPGDTLYEGPATIAALSTIPYYGFGFRMFPWAGEREGKMQLRVSTVSSVLFVKNFPAIWRGEYENPEALFDFYVDAVDIELDPPTNFQIGGDIQGLRTKVSARLHDPIRVVDFYAPPR